ncbi:hypothetical protein OBP_227 [Pseudomonas phage OBP]|uniref:hypothetical protein n=1 Tax=Pseudomonas phage OBP TaxID=1124849 RepID=UPI000240D5C7|nr:hypothetical protein OBP_227 [Pseudomonas phage OBP]AEV89664.1 hypothetical protein OBP_227 [Pseudomonas phage OBP]
MAVLIDGITLDVDQLRRIQMLYGSIEKMKTYPFWIECQQKHKYLTDLIENIKIGRQMEKDNTPRWNILSRWIVSPLGTWGMNKFIIPRIEKLKEKYQTLLTLPAGFAVSAANEEFDKFIEELGNFIAVTNKITGIKDDPYVKPKA